MPRSTRSATPSPRTGALGTVALGLTVIAMGAVPTLAALDVIPSADSEFGAPRPIVALLASTFIWVGVMIIVQALPAALGARVPQGWDDAVGRVFGNLIVLVFVTGGTALLLWLLLDGGGARGSSSVTLGPFSMLVPPVVAWVVDRFFLSLFAGLMLVLCGAVWFNAVRGSFRWVRTNVR